MLIFNINGVRSLIQHRRMLVQNYMFEYQEETQIGTRVASVRAQPNLRFNSLIF